MTHLAPLYKKKREIITISLIYMYNRVIVSKILHCNTQLVHVKWTTVLKWTWFYCSFHEDHYCCKFLAKIVINLIFVNAIVFKQEQKITITRTEFVIQR